MSEQMEQTTMEETFMNKPEEEKDIAGESRADKFKRLAPPRVNKILHALDTLGNCAGPSYEYTEEQVAKMFDAIQNKVDSVKAGFEKKKQEPETFSF